MLEILKDVPFIENKEELVAIQRKFNIPEDRFVKGVLFAHYITEGDNKVVAYQKVANCDKDKARQNAGSLFKGKWIQELIRFMTPDDNTLYIGDIKTIIASGMDIINDKGSSAREKTDAMKALQPYIKQAKLAVEIEENIKISIGETTVAKIGEQLKQLVGVGKMVDEKGEIIDVQYIE